MENLKDLNNSFSDTLKDSNLQSVSIELGEVIADSFLQEGLLKDIPIIGTIVGLGKSSISISDHLFLKKIIHFIVGIKHIEKEKRNKLISKIESSKKYRIKVGEKLLYIIDKCEDHIATQYIAKLFTAFLDEQISYPEFLRGATVIQRIFIEDLNYFLTAPLEELSKEFDAEYYLSDFEANLISAGLCATGSESISIRDQDDWKMDNKYVVEGGATILFLTDIGKTLRKVLGENSED